MIVDRVLTNDTDVAVVAHDGIGRWVVAVEGVAPGAEHPVRSFTTRRSALRHARKFLGIN